MCLLFLVVSSLTESKTQILKTNADNVHVLVGEGFIQNKYTFLLTLSLVAKCLWWHGYKLCDKIVLGLRLILVISLCIDKKEKKGVS